MTFRNLFTTAAVAAVAFGLSLTTAATARAQALAPLLLADCEAAPTSITLTVCDPQPQLDYTYKQTDPGRNLTPAAGVAVSPDGSRVFVSFTYVIEVYQRNTATGELTYESCIVDAAAAPNSLAPLKLPQPCQVTAPMLSLDQGAPYMTVSPDGATLYLTTQSTLTVLAVGPTLAFVNCWKSADQFGSDPSLWGPCHPLSTGVTTGEMRWDTVTSPTVSADGQHVYVNVTAPANSGSIPETDRRAAVLHFSRNASTGDLSFLDCAGVVQGRVLAPFPQNVIWYSVPCSGDAGALDVRNAGALRFVSHPVLQTASLVLTASASNTLGDSDAIARLSIRADGSLGFAQCMLASGGTCAAGEGVAYGGSANGIHVTTNQKDAYFNTHYPAHVRFADDGTMTRQADVDPALYFMRAYALGPNDASLMQVDGTRITVFDRNAATGALTYRACATSDIYTSPTCDPSLPADGTYWSAQLATSTPDGGMVTAAGAAYAISSFVRGYKLTVTPGANGTLTSSPGIIDCGAICQDVFPAGSSVSLAATPASTYVFDAFGGDCAGSASPCGLTMDADKTVSATFKTLQYTLTIAADAGGTVTSSPAGIDCGTACVTSFDTGATVLLHATPAAGFVFNGWTGDCAGVTGDCVLLMNQNRAAGPLFSGVYTLTTTIVGSGTVATASGSTGIQCPGDCTETFPSGTSVTLAASASAGYAFSGWSGDCSGTGTCVIAMSQPRNVTATFVSLTPAAPSALNAVVTSAKVAKKTTVYSGALAWTDNSTNETAFLVQRYRTAKGKCTLDTGFGTVTLAANSVAYTDATATSATCGYQVAAQNGTFVSAWVRDMNVGAGVKP